MKFLSCGAGMQSTALALMSCENKRDPNKYPHVPVYDAIIFCDLFSEAPWVYEQVKFIRQACNEAEIPFHVLSSNLYKDYMLKFGKKRTVAVPFWSLDEKGKKAKLKRNCTIDYKILVIQKFVRYKYLGYERYQKSRKEDISAHEMHLGFSIGEEKRVSVSQHPFFVNKYPLIEMNLKREDTYAYNLDTWKLETKASACFFCPFHRNYFFKYLKEHYPKDYDKVIALDDLLEKNQPLTAIKDKIFISRSRKRIKDLSANDFNDAEFFDYFGKMIWNGF